MKNHKKIIIFFSVLVLLTTIFIYHNLDFYFLRSKTALEKNNLQCITGLSSQSYDPQLIKHFGIINVFLAWQDKFPKSISSKLNQKQILMITWEPYLNDPQAPSILQDILDHKYDDLIQEFALNLKEYQKPVLLRWGHEMNSDWYSWSGMYNDRNSKVYIKTFQYIHHIFQQLNCDNVKFVFSVNAQDIPAKKWNRFENYYPGDKYVDIIGLDAYNWGTTQKWHRFFRSRWTNPKKMLRKPYERIIQSFPSKPIILTEIGTTSQGGDKQKWLENFFQILPQRFKAIKGFVWFDIIKETDWAISSNAKNWNLYRQQTNNDYFTYDHKDIRWLIK
jgi:beta-mannanase